MTMNGAVMPVMAMFIVAAEEQVGMPHCTEQIYNYPSGALTEQYCHAGHD